MTDIDNQTLGIIIIINLKKTIDCCNKNSVDCITHKRTSHTSK